MNMKMEWLKGLGGMKISVLPWMLLLVLFGMNCLCDDDEPWDYSHWKVTKKSTVYADINAAKKEARDKKRPLLIAFSKTSGCVACTEYWRNVACDGKHAHDRYCKLGNTVNDHPICKFAEDHKIVLLYIDASINALVNKIQGTEYKQYLPRPPFNATPIYFMVHVKDDADCESENADLLNVGNDPGDQVDFIFGYLGQGGNAVYDSTGKKSSLSVLMTNNQGVKSFESNIETVFSENSGFNTYGLSLEPPDGGDDPEPGDENDGSSISKAMASVEIGKWTTNYSSAKTSAKSKGEPLVVAYVKDMTSTEAKALDSYVQTSDFKNAFSTNYLAVINAANNSDITPKSNVELVYLRSDGTIVGRLSNDPNAPTDGTVAKVDNFNGDNANKFSQFATLASDKDEEANNTKNGAVVLGTTASGIQIGGVDAVDWFTYTGGEAKRGSDDYNMTWQFTLKGETDSSDKVNVAIFKEGNNTSTPESDKEIVLNKNGETINYNPSASNEKVYLRVKSIDISEPKPYSITVTQKVVNCTVSFDKSEIRKQYKNEPDEDEFVFVEIPVTLSAVNASLEKDVDVTVNMDYDKETFIDGNEFDKWKKKGLKLEESDTENEGTSSLTLTWKKIDTTVFPSKKIVKLLLPKLDNTDATWDKLKIIKLDLENKQDDQNVDFLPTPSMTVALYTTVEKAGLNPDQPDVEFEGEVAKVTVDNLDDKVSPKTYNIEIPEGTEDVYWKKIEGDFPDGLVKIEKSDNGYQLVLSNEIENPTDTESPKTYSFKIMLYSVKNTYHEIVDGGTVKITCTVTPKQADQSATRFKEPNTKISGAILEESKESEGKRNPESGDSSSKKDVKGSIDVTVGEENKVSATVITCYGEATLEGKWTDDDDPSKLMATLDGYTEDNYHYQLRLAVDVTGKIDGSELAVTNNDTDVKLSNDIIGQVKEYS
ncbi:MAG: hypothetical protein J6X55_11755, partial [Victivallales bacterium]|nr:hypothetical protein [Victivallales bacterium]